MNINMWAIVGGVVLGLVAWTVYTRRQRLAVFLTGVNEEIRQVSWPTRDDLLGSALVVFVGVTLLGLFISACDLVLSAIQIRLLQ